MTTENLLRKKEVAKLTCLLIAHGGSVGRCRPVDPSEILGGVRFRSSEVQAIMNGGGL